MAIRQIREIGDEILTKKCKEVPKMTLRTKILIGDMLETMYDKNGVGLAAPQVGVLKQIVVIDVGEGPIVLINPEIIETSGEQMPERPWKMGLCDPSGPCEGACPEPGHGTFRDGGRGPSGESVLP